jgi:hypothetical protein
VRPLTISVRNLLESDAVFAKMGDRINAETVGKVKGVFRFDIVEGKRKVVKSWTADLKNGDGSLVEGEGARVNKIVLINLKVLCSPIARSFSPMKFFVNWPQAS